MDGPETTENWAEGAAARKCYEITYPFVNPLFLDLGDSGFSVGG
jgi:hypothetical protein